MTDTFNVLNAYDQSLLKTLNHHTAQDVETLLSRATQAFADKKQWLSIEARCAILNQTADFIARDAEHLALQIAAEGGKPLVDARIEVQRAQDSVRVCIETLRTTHGQAIPMGLNAASSQRYAFTTAQPLGLVVAVSAFNHPLNLIAHQVAPAVAVGCPVIVKPASATPLSAQSFVNYLHEAGLPPAWCQLALLDTANAQRLVTDPRVAFFSFIGSAKVGWMLRSQLAPGTRCALEHGGSAPVIIDESADIDALIPKLLKGGFYHAGQVCVSVQRVYAPKHLAQSIAEKLAQGAAKLSVGDPSLATTDVGPLISPKEVTRIDSWVQAAIQAGAHCLTGGQAIRETCYQPTVLLNPPAQSQVLTHEVFGPVVSVVSYDAFDQAIAQANHPDLAFQASIFSQNIDRALQAATDLNASAVMINDHTAFRVDWMPFAGLKHSGLGTGGIPYSMHDMTYDKMIVSSYPHL